MGCNGRLEWEDGYLFKFSSAQRIDSLFSGAICGDQSRAGPSHAEKWKNRLLLLAVGWRFTIWRAEDWGRVWEHGNISALLPQVHPREGLDVRLLREMLFLKLILCLSVHPCCRWPRRRLIAAGVLHNRLLCVCYISAWGLILNTLYTVCHL